MHENKYRRSVFSDKSPILQDPCRSWNDKITNSFCRQSPCGSSWIRGHLSDLRHVSLHVGTLDTRVLFRPNTQVKTINCKIAKLSFCVDVLNKSIMIAFTSQQYCSSYLPPTMISYSIIHYRDAHYQISIASVEIARLNQNKRKH